MLGSSPKMIGTSDVEMPQQVRNLVCTMLKLLCQKFLKYDNVYARELV